MHAYEFDNKIYCANCYMKFVPKEDRKPIHSMEGTEFFHRFQGDSVICVGCEIAIRYDQLDKGTYQSFGMSKKAL